MNSILESKFNLGCIAGHKWYTPSDPLLFVDGRCGMMGCDKPLRVIRDGKLTSETNIIQRRLN